MNAILAFLLRLFLTLLCYIFVGWIGYTIYLDLRGGIRGREKVTIPPITLVAKINQEDSERRFKKSEILLGRDHACDFSLDDVAISLRHCKLSFHHKQWWAEDLESTNGSYLNNSLIESAIVLTDGDELRLGHSAISIKIN